MHCTFLISNTNHSHAGYCQPGFYYRRLVWRQQARSFTGMLFVISLPEITQTFQTSDCVFCLKYLGDPAADPDLFPQLTLSLTFLSFCARFRTANSSFSSAELLSFSILSWPRSSAKAASESLPTRTVAPNETAGSGHDGGGSAP